MGNKRCELTEEKWDRIRPLIPRSKIGRPPKDDWLMVNTMLWLACSGTDWENLPERHDPWKTVYSRFCKCRGDATFLRIFESLNEDADIENMSLDSKIKKYAHTVQGLKGAVDSGNWQCIGVSRGGKATKFYAVVDGLGSPVYWKLTGGNVNDSTVAVDILSHIDISNSTMLADRAYGTNEILDYIQRQDGDYVIQPKSNTRNPWKCDWFVYRERHPVENFS